MMTIDDTLKEKKEIMKKEIKKIVEIMVQQTRDHVPESGDFAPIFEVFSNPDPALDEYVGKCGLKVYKMQKSSVPDPRKRYVEAAAYVPSGMYKSDCTVASGTKEEIIAIMQTEAFVEKLYESYNYFADIFINYD